MQHHDFKYRKHADDYLIETALKCEKMAIPQPELPRKRQLPKYYMSIQLLKTIILYILKLNSDLK